jgi:hypothetical protein
MKIEIGESTVKSAGVDQRTNFTIEASSKAFIILSNTLYSDKILAVVRELSTNASDAHKEVGKKDIPFYTHIPTTYHPFFYIRDFGPGLSHEDCMSLYTTYFRSTKTNTNELNGCLGLGSKSPFAYTDSFTVESYFQGMKRTYVAAMDSSGPTFNLLNEEETTEESGLKVIIPVLSRDFGTFHTKARNIYKYFDVKPQSNMNIDSEKEEVIISNNNWSIVKNGYNNLVIMGQIAYPIDSHKFSGDIGSFLSKVNGLRIKVDIGEVEMTPSREELSYNQKTIDAINKYIEIIAEESTKEFQDNLEACESTHLARVYYYNSSFFLKPQQNSVQYKGTNLFEKNNNYSNSRLIETQSDKFMKYEYPNRPYRKVDYYDILASFVICSPSEKVTYSKERIRKLNNTSKAIYLFSGTRQELIDTIGHNDLNAPFIYDIKDLPFDKTTRSSNAQGSLPCSKFNNATYKFDDSKFSVKYEDAYFIEESRGKFSIINKEFHKNDVCSFLRSLESIGFDLDIEIYSVKPSQAADLKTRKNWKSLEEAIKEFLDEYTKDYTDDLKLYKTTIDDLPMWANDLKKITSNQQILDIIKDYEDLKEKKTKAMKKIATIKDSNIVTLLLINVISDVVQHGKELKKIVSDTYPLLETYDWQKLEKKHKTYVQQLERLKELEEKFQENTLQSVEI